MFMIKRVFSAILCIILAIGVFAIPANALDIGADTLIVCDAAAMPGDIVTIEVYVVNIVRPAGILTCDLPFFYDSKLLEFVTVEGIFPKNWDGYGEYLGESEHSKNREDGRVILRAFPEVPELELGTNCPYNVKEDKAMGFRLTFRAKAEGTAKLEIKDSKKCNIYVVDALTAKNFAGKPTSVEMVISKDEKLVGELNGENGGEESGTPDTSDSKDPESGDPSESSDVDVSTDQSGDLSVEESVDTSDESVTSGETPDDSQELSDSAESKEEDTSKAQDSKADKKDKDDGNVKKIFTIIAIVVAVLAGGGAAGYFLYFKKKKK